MTAPKHSYIVLTEHEGSHSVLVKYDALPGWLQHIATFRDKDRADGYAEIENSFADDESYPGGPDIGLPKNLPAEAPPSALPLVYGTTQPATRTADQPPADRHDTVPADNSSVGQAGRPESSGIPDARPAEFPEAAEQEPDPDPVGTFVDRLFEEQTPAAVFVGTVVPARARDAAQDGVVDGVWLSAMQRTIYDALVAAAERGETAPKNIDLARMVGHDYDAAASGVMAVLEKKGLIVRAGDLGERTITIVATGKRTAPRGKWSRSPGAGHLAVSSAPPQVASEAPEIDLTPAVQALPVADREAAVLEVYRRADAAGDWLSHARIAERSGIPVGSLSKILDRLLASGKLARGAKGYLPHLPGTIPVPLPTQSTFAKAAHVQVKPTVKFKDEVTPVTPPAQRRFTDHAVLAPDLVKGLPADHAAVVEGRTLFPSTVVDAADSPHLLVSGHNSRKTGGRVTKGPWRGMPIYTLTLEERATCPTSCDLWSRCYGNSMPFARRHRHGDEFERLLELEIAALNAEHPGGFVVRLHILGDFYSVEYLAAWDIWLSRYPALHAFGYTAHQPGTEMGDIIAFMRDGRWNRFAIRTSAQQNSLPTGARTIFRKPETAVVAEGIVCPAQTNKTDCCGSCGLCWAPAAKDKTIVFIAHGRIGKAPNVPAAVPQTTAIAEALTVAAKPSGLKVGALPLAPNKFNSYLRKRNPIPPGTKVETPEEFLARGGQVTKAAPGHAMGTIDHSVGPVTVRPKHGY